MIYFQSNLYSKYPPNTPWSVWADKSVFFAVSQADGLLQCQASCNTFVIIRGCTLHTAECTHSPHCALLCSTPTVCDRLWQPVHVRRVHSLLPWEQVNCAQRKKKKRRRIECTDTKAIGSLHIDRECLEVGFISLCQQRRTDGELIITAVCCTDVSNNVNL